jgi:signal transduction histidine kinase
VAGVFARKPILRAAVIVGVYFAAWIVFDALSTYYYTGNYVGATRASPWYLSVTLTFYLVYACGEAFAPAGIAVEWLRAAIIGVNAPVTLPVLTAFGIQQVLIYGGAAVVLRRLLRVRIPFAELRDVVLYVVVAAGAAPLLAGITGVLIFVAVGAVPWHDYWQQVGTFAVGDAIGFITLVPVLSIVAAPFLSPALALPAEPNELRLGRAERIALPCLLTVCAVVGYRWLAAGGGAPLYYFLFLPLVWMAARGGLRFAAIGVAYADLSVVALDAWFRIPASSSLAYQSYVAASSLTALTIGAIVTQRWRAERQYAGLLETQVAERTAQLNQTLREASIANSELEAFVYAISHDLRAPLRAMSGFASSLCDNLAASLDKQNLHYLERIVASANRMAGMLDALLGLAGVSRSDLRLEPVDMSAAARELIDELLVAYPGRTVEVDVAEGIMAVGDRRLLEDLLQNLLGNALKFTSRQPRARVEFGAYTHGRETVYFVKDDGVGFDMAHTGKLFGAFSRLHAPNEFGGAGVGLATVQRIVQRHGGKIWAESQPGRGACFSFTLNARAQ